jgi:hypothetical protein
MDAHLTLKEHHNQGIIKARTAQASLRTLTEIYRIVSESVRADQVACFQAVTLYGSELVCDPKEAGKRDKLQFLFDQKARSILGGLPTTPCRALMTDSALTPSHVIVESR